MSDKNMKNNDLISVIIPVYNAERFVAQTLDSVLEQTYENWEAILVNDGSIDNSLEILQKYAKKDKRFKIINKQNEKLSAARNDGLKIATGKYITFLDADDMWYPQFLEFMLQAMQTQNADVVWCRYNECDENAGLEVRRFYDYMPKTMVCENMLRQFSLHLKPKATILVWDKLYKAEILKGLEFSREYKAMAEDFQYSIKVFARRPKAVYIEVPLTAYRQNSNSASHQKMSYTVADSHIILLEDCMNILENYEPREDVAALQKRIIPIVYRYTCTYPYFRAYKECEAYWAHYLPICKKIVEDGYFKMNMLSPFQRFIYGLYLKKHWKLLRCFLAVYHLVKNKK